MIEKVLANRIAMPKSRHKRRLRIVLLGVLVAFGLVAAACVDDDESAAQREKASTDTPAESDDVEVTVRFVAFGDVDRSDGISLGVVPDVRIAVIKDDDVSGWWKSVTGIEGYLSPTYYIPPGAQVQSSFDGISTAPASFVTTGLDGTIETVFRFDSGAIGRRMFCVISPLDENLIAGCSQIENVWLPTFDSLDTTFYIYFSDGRAYVDRNSSRYQQFIGEASAPEEISDATATVTFVSTFYSDIYPPVFLRNILIAVIEDEDIGNWWRTISDNRLHNEHEVLFIDHHADIHFDTRVIDNMPIRIANTGHDAIAKIELEPGDYLLCEANNGSIGGCVYEYIAASQSYEYEISDSGEGGFYMDRQSEGYIERLLIDSQDWEFNG